MCGFIVLEKKLKGIKGEQLLNEKLSLIAHRGPDHTNIVLIGEVVLCFHRLAIMDLSDDGNQPFSSQDDQHGLHVLCNGEIYNEQTIKTDYKDNYKFISSSDCEVLLPMLQENSLEVVCQNLDAEFAFCGHDEKNNKLFAARDSMGIRPLFYGTIIENKKMAFASEAKALIGICEDIYPFPPGHYYEAGEIKPFHDHGKVETFLSPTFEDATSTIKKLLELSVIKRLQSDAPIGFLLSGGLDSSLVCAIAAKYLDKPIQTFSIGIQDGPIDTKYAKIVADYIGSDHREILFTKDEMFEALEDIIYSIESFDITTVRASVGMYLICKFIKEKTNIKVLLTGEVSDEIFGYKYTDFAPNEQAFQDEAAKRVRELYLYDVLRADRCLSAHSIEARVPFSDKSLVDYVMALNPKLKMNTTGVGKYLLRKAFDGSGYLPQEILYRDKAAFSDAVGHSMVDYLKEHSESKYSDADLSLAQKKYQHASPISKEALWYREVFEKHFKGLASSLIKGFWMPNKEWKNCDVNDPSARVLPNYGKSGE